MTRLAVLVLALAAPALAAAWGWQGHKLISELAVERLPAQLQELYRPRMKQLMDSTIEPDKRVFTDKSEGPKHFLNVEVLDPTYRARWTPPRDQNPEPKPPAGDVEQPHTLPLQQDVFGGRLPVSADAADRLFASIPRDHAGYLELPPAYRKEMGAVVYQPTHYHAELAKAFRSGDVARIVSATGYLSHYVGDLHVPLHNTINHDGSFSKSLFGAKGQNSTVHSRFETGYLRFRGDAVKQSVRRHLGTPVPQDPSGITARALRESREAFAFYPRVIDADRISLAKSPATWQTFHPDWHPRVAPIVELQLARSTRMLADLIVSAWYESKRER